MMFKVTADTTFKVFNVNAITDTSANGDGVFISDDDSTEGKAAYILGRVNYLRPAAAVSWDDIQAFIDFASQVGGGDA
jgi:formylglycine-generating enzyme required for sulfatase activity